MALFNPITRFCGFFFSPAPISSPLFGYFAVSSLQKYSVLQLQISDAFQTNPWGCHSRAADAADAALRAEGI